MEENKYEKLNEREIRFGAPGQKRPEKEHGRVYRWLDNFWYHHKWAVIAALAVVIVLTVCIAQMCGREEEGDIVVITAGPYGYVTNEAGQRDVSHCLATYLADDYNGNGKKDITLRHYTVYSEEEIRALENRVDENGQPSGVTVDRYQSTQSYQAFTQYLTTGDAALMLVSPWIAEEYSAGRAVLVDFGEIFESLPAGAILTTREDGTTACYGIRLAETALWRDNSAIRNNLPEDTVICLLRPGILGNNADEVRYQGTVALVKKIVQ